MFMLNQIYESESESESIRLLKIIYPIEINMYNLETQSLNFMRSHVEYLKVRAWALFYLILLLMILLQQQKN